MNIKHVSLVLAFVAAWIAFVLIIPLTPGGPPNLSAVSGNQTAAKTNVVGQSRQAEAASPTQVRQPVAQVAAQVTSSPAMSATALSPGIAPLRAGTSEPHIALLAD